MSTTITFALRGTYADGTTRQQHVTSSDIGAYAKRLLEGVAPFVRVEVRTCDNNWACDCSDTWDAVDRSRVRTFGAPSITDLQDNLRSVWAAQADVEPDDTFAVLELGDAETFWTNKLLDAGVTEDTLSAMYLVHHRAATRVM